MKKYSILKYNNIYSVLKYIEYKKSVGYKKIFESESKEECNEFIEKVKGLNNMNKYKFKLLTSTGLGHEYFYCYGDEHFEQWLKRKNIKYEIDKKA